MLTTIAVVVIGIIAGAVGFAAGMVYERDNNGTVKLHEKIGDLEARLGYELQAAKKVGRIVEAYQMRLAEARMNQNALRHRIDCPVAFLEDANYACDCSEFRLKWRPTKIFEGGRS